MTKPAVLTDLPALDAVLDDFSQFKVDYVVVAGDAFVTHFFDCGYCVPCITYLATIATEGKFIYIAV